MKRFAERLLWLGMALLVAAGHPLFGAGDLKSSKRSREEHPSATKVRLHRSAQSSLLSKKGWRHGRQHRQLAPTKDRIREIQTGLTRAGFYHGEPTGTWDSSTVDAMKRFQQAQGLNSSGKIDARTLQKLGLGSDIAGLAAPRPPLPPATPPETRPQTPRN